MESKKNRKLGQFAFQYTQTAETYGGERMYDTLMRLMQVLDRDKNEPVWRMLYCYGDYFPASFVVNDMKPGVLAWRI